MAKRTAMTHSDDALTLHVKGDKRHPEPTMHVIQFPGGHVEVSRCSTGDEYWSHIHLHDCTEIVGSRVAYNFEGARKAEAMGIPAIHEMPLQSYINQIALKVKGQFSISILKNQ